MKPLIFTKKYRLLYTSFQFSRHEMHYNVSHTYTYQFNGNNNGNVVAKQGNLHKWKYNNTVITYLFA